MLSGALFKSCFGSCGIWLQLHGAIYRPDSFVMMLRYCANFKAIRYESTSLNRTVADKSHRVIVAYGNDHFMFERTKFNRLNLIVKKNNSTGLY